jgi:phosphoribosyl 1,2-cyclic phosphodiesterase
VQREGGLRSHRDKMKGLMRFSILASGSKGNSCYIETDSARILVDAGLSAGEIERRLKWVGVEARSLDGIIITHEHGDHIKGAGPLSRRHKIPVYLNQKTFEGGSKQLGRLPMPVITQTGKPYAIRDICVETFTKCHDAADPVGLLLSFNGVRMGVATDLGRSTHLIEDRLKNCRVLILEFNHDPVMLDEGPYPLFLKQRIKGRDGHLSNDQAGELLRVLCHQNLDHVAIAHISEINNHPDKAYQCASHVLAEKGLWKTKISISRQDEAGPMIELR